MVMVNNSKKFFLVCSIASSAVSGSGWLASAFVPHRHLPSARLHTHQSDASPKKYPTSTSQIMSFKNNNDDKVQKAPVTEKVLDLQMHTRRKSPAETLASLSDACETLGIDTFDVYGDFDSDEEQSYLRRFEAEVAQTFGMEDGVFCLSGGMAQSIALLIHAGKKFPSSIHDDSDGTGKRGAAFACHPTSHLLLHENNAFSELLGMEAVVIDPNSDSTNNGNPIQYYDPEALKVNGCYGMEPIRLSHVQNLFSSLDAGSASSSATDEYDLTYPNKKTINNNCTEISTLILELPHREVGGKLTPWEEVEEISRLCEKRGVKYHCDGARIFEASAGYGHKSLGQTAQPFTSVYISFYKGLGAISGAMLLGDSEFCSEARVWLRRMGGNLYTVMPYAISSWEGFRRNCLKEEVLSNNEDDQSQHCNLVYDQGIFENRRKKLARVLELLHADTRITPIVQFDPAVPETNIVHGYLRMSHDECMAALEKVEHSTGIRVLSRVRSCHGSNDSSDANNQKFGCRFEWTMGESNSLIEDEDFVIGWNAFAQEVLVGNSIAG